VPEKTRLLRRPANAELLAMTGTGLFTKPSIFDDLVKSLKIRFFVIPAKAGIQSFQIVISSLDYGFHLSARHRQAGVTAFYEAINIGL